MKRTRRSFLRVAGLSVFALSSGITSLSGEARAAVAPGHYEQGQTDTKGLQAKRWAMVIDTREFKTALDYQPMIDACNQAHNIPKISGKDAEGHEHQGIMWMWTDTFEHTFPEEGNHYLNDRVKARVYPLLCNHCSNPPCVRVCPTQATYKLDNGIVTMDYHRCIGCRFCMAGCPYGARSFNFVDPRKYLPDPVPNPEFPTRMIGVVEKCTFCVERLAKGLMPACVKASKGKILFGDLEDPNSNVRKALAENYTIRRKPSIGTQPGVYYII